MASSAASLSPDLASINFNPSSPPPSPATTSTTSATAPNQEQSTQQTDESVQIDEGELENGEEAEEGECPFCIFMKGGGCKESFVAWEKCVEEGEKAGEDIAERCFEVTASLKKCMEAHADYYKPILDAEQAMLDAADDVAADVKDGAAAGSTTAEISVTTGEKKD